jgi:GNAT superfamily N-acetyltransferase
LVVDVDRSAVGTLSLRQEGGDAGIYGFVIDPSWQGRGLGRDALRRACAPTARAESAWRWPSTTTERSRFTRLSASCP